MLGASSTRRLIARAAFAAEGVLLRTAARRHRGQLHRTRRTRPSSRVRDAHCVPCRCLPLPNVVRNRISTYAAFHDTFPPQPAFLIREGFEHGRYPGRTSSPRGSERTFLKREGLQRTKCHSSFRPSPPIAPHRERRATARRQFRARRGACPDVLMRYAPGEGLAEQTYTNPSVAHTSMPERARARTSGARSFVRRPTLPGASARSRFYSPCFSSTKEESHAAACSGVCLS
jgi:hypothetical protein